jgi:hypothetical protein
MEARMAKSGGLLRVIEGAIPYLAEIILALAFLIGTIVTAFVNPYALAAAVGAAFAWYAVRVTKRRT